MRCKGHRSIKGEDEGVEDKADYVVYSLVKHNFPKACPMFSSVVIA